VDCEFHTVERVLSFELFLTTRQVVITGLIRGFASCGLLLLLGRSSSRSFAADANGWSLALASSAAAAAAAP
jgi:hypothetical protein